MANQEIEANKATEIRQVRRVATGILILLTVIFAASFCVAAPPTWLLFIRAMAEAGMVGGLADSFAVEALFRHPLRIPIPHTALLPNNQKRAAGNIARFIDEHFMVPEHLLGQLGRVNPVRKLATWLSLRQNAAVLSGEVAHLLELFLLSLRKRGLGAGPVAVLRDLMLGAVDSATLARHISTLLKGSAHSQLLNDILLQVRDVLDDNRGKVLQIVQDRSRWWIASTVDRRMVTVLVDGILSIIDELADENSGLRRDFEGSVTKLIERFQETGLIAERIDEGMAKFASSPEFSLALEEFVAAVLDEIGKGFESDGSKIQTMLEKAIVDFAQTLLDDREMEDRLNQRLLAGMETVLNEMRPTIVRHISSTISEWDSDQLVARMEAEVGRDLQFIRINGAVLGAFVGGVLFIVTHLHTFF